jgi:hypothetical protein
VESTCSGKNSKERPDPNNKVYCMKLSDEGTFTGPFKNTTLMQYAAQLYWLMVTAEKPKSKTEKRANHQQHHLISRATHGEDTLENLVWLTVVDHLKVHLLLAMLIDIPALHQAAALMARLPQEQENRVPLISLLDAIKDAKMLDQYEASVLKANLAAGERMMGNDYGLGK